MDQLVSKVPAEQESYLHKFEEDKKTILALVNMYRSRKSFIEAGAISDYRIQGLLPDGSTIPKSSDEVISVLSFRL